jgi:hypothetical protein
MESNTINKVIDALKAIVRIALLQGFSKTSYLVTNHIKYIKNIRNADDPVRYISFVAKKLFPDEISILKKFEQIELKYKDELLFRFKELYAIYLEIAREKPPQRKNISEAEADNILSELLF